MRAVLGLIIGMVAGLSLAVSATGAHADPVTVANSAPAGGSYVPVTPFRLLDTHTAISSTTVTTGGHNGVPTTGVSAVAVTLSAVAPAHAGSVVGYRPGAAVPSVTNLIFGAGDTTTAANVFATDASGAFAVRASTPVRVLVDVTGYFTDAAHATTTGRYVPLDSSRLYDSRSTHAAIPAHGTRTLTVAGTHGVPKSGAQSVVVNIVAVSPKGSGYLTAYAGSTRPYVTTLSYRTGVTRADRFFVRPDSAGRITIFASAATDLIVDVNGYFADSPAGGYYVPVGSTRAYDSRRPNAGGPITVGGERFVDIPDGLIPSASSLAPAVAVLSSVTTVPPPQHPDSGYLTMWGSDSQPRTSDINYSATRPVGNLALPTIGSGQMINLATSSRAGVDTVMDVSGYFARAMPPSLPAGVWRVSPDGSQAPQLVNDLAGVRQVTTTLEDGAALLSDGTVWSWFYLMGRGSPREGSTPRQLTSLSGVVSLTSGSLDYYALDRAGQVWAWGTANSRGQLGNGTTTASGTPHPVPGLPTITRVFAPPSAAYAVGTDGAVYGWGSNTEGSLGDGTTTGRLSPVEITGLSDPVSLSGLGTATEALEADGTLMVWGGSSVLAPTPHASPCAGAIRAVGSSFAVLCADGTVTGSPAFDGAAHLTATGDRVAAVRDDGTVWVRGATAWIRLPGVTGATTIGQNAGYVLAAAG